MVGAVAMASVYQTQEWGRVGAPGRNIHSAQEWRGGSEWGRSGGGARAGSRSGILGKGAASQVQTGARDSSRKQLWRVRRACGEGKLQVLG